MKSKKRYIVYMKEVNFYTVSVEAKDDLDAMHKAEHLYSVDDCPLSDSIMYVTNVDEIKYLIK